MISAVSVLHFGFHLNLLGHPIRRNIFVTIIRLRDLSIPLKLGEPPHLRGQNSRASERVPVVYLHSLTNGAVAVGLLYQLFSLTLC